MLAQLGKRGEKLLNITINEWIKYGMMTENQKETLLQGALNKKSKKLH